MDTSFPRFSEKPTKLYQGPSLWKISSSVLRRDSLALCTWNFKECNNTLSQEWQNFCYLQLQLWDFTDQNQEVVFPGVLSSLFFFLFVTGRGWSCLIELQGTNGCEAHTWGNCWENLVEKGTGSLQKERKTGSRIYDAETVGFRGQGGEREEGMTKQGT